MPDSSPITQTEWNQIQDLIKCLDAGDLEEGFETSFVTSMKAKRRDWTLSEAQSTKLEQLWVKHCGNRY